MFLSRTSRLYDALRSDVSAPASGLHDHAPATGAQAQSNLMLTENKGVTHASTLYPPLDLFNNLSVPFSPYDARSWLEKSWEVNPEETLKIIWNARSIGDGKGEGETFVRAAAWLKEKHPRTLLGNLEWLVEPVSEKAKIEKKQKKEEDMDVEIVDVKEEVEEELNAANARSHGYWKDLLNLLVLSAVDEFDIEGDFTVVPNYTTSSTEDQKRMWGRIPPLKPRAKSRRRARSTITAAAKEEKNKRIEANNLEKVEMKKVLQEKGLIEDTPEWEEALKKLEVDKGKEKRRVREDRHFSNILQPKLTGKDDFHLLLTITVARLFARQLRRDLTNLKTYEDLKKAGKEEEARKVARNISLCAKWAPSAGFMADRWTAISLYVAVSLFPPSNNKFTESYINYASQHYRTDYLKPLRAFLPIVEQNISANDFKSIAYSRVPSVAMKTYTKLFHNKDPEGFSKYLTKVAMGQANISGAILTPGSLVHAFRARGKQEVEKRVAEVQWVTLLKHTAANGALKGCVAVCDVSGSMTSPVFKDGTSPMDSSIGFGILIAQLSSPPFHNSIITFSAEPKFVDIKPVNLDSAEPSPSDLVLSENVKSAERDVGYNTNFVAVFRLILNKAKEHNLKQEELPEKCFVFSDMEFDACETGGERWRTHYQTIKSEYEQAGYEIPEMVFWNLAGGRTGRHTSKPVTAEVEGAALLSGYSAAMIKLFLEKGMPTDEEEEEWEEVVDAAAGETATVKKEKKKMDPVAVMRKAIGGKSFERLKVYD
ncbi:hypothetical protein BT69DRAFT_1351461 [Atractiella rhizophila]|nr:hypothetical protein BT69DRAFT_1351461 [Atractiella rhizophila]